MICLFKKLITKCDLLELIQNIRNENFQNPRDHAILNVGEFKTKIWDMWLYDLFIKLDILCMYIFKSSKRLYADIYVTKKLNNVLDWRLSYILLN